MATQPDIFSQVRFLVVERGLKVEDAIREIESILKSKVPESILSLIREESYKW